MTNQCLDRESGKAFAIHGQSLVRRAPGSSSNTIQLGASCTASLQAGASLIYQPRFLRCIVSFSCVAYLRQVGLLSRPERSHRDRSHP